MEKKRHICPNCNRVYYDEPALSRKDNKTEICSDCGIREALTAAGYDPLIQEEYIRQMHKAYEV